MAKKRPKTKRPVSPRNRPGRVGDMMQFVDEGLLKSRYKRKQQADKRKKKKKQLGKRK